MRYIWRMRPARPLDKRCPLYKWFKENPGQTQSDLARLADVNSVSVMNYLRGRRGLRFEAFERLSKVTGISLSDLQAWAYKGKKAKGADAGGAR